MQKACSEKKGNYEGLGLGLGLAKVKVMYVKVVEGKR